MGFSLSEISEMQIGQVLDYMAEYVKQKDDSGKTKRKATQADIDAF
ncbi:hypothetical protein R4Y45_07245 [Holzapfeliella sp. He02]|uniref:Uncharacterized protein n=1 Tax=Holzapfeliella saturejae TaxID=3082953 RepID=A0ABU8SI58_9LACO